MSKIIHKKSAVVGKVPLAADLDYGELAINYTDGFLFYKAADNTVQRIKAAGSGWQLKTSNYTAVTGNNLITNTASGSFTITLPAAPQLGDTITIGDGADWATNALTVARNGSTIEGLAEDFVLDVKGAQAVFVYDGSTWQVFTNIAVSIPGNYNDLINKPNFATVATSGSYNDLLNKPTLSTVAGTGSYTDLLNKPTLSTVAGTGSYNDLLNKPNLATVATSGSYTDLLNKPTNVSEFTNDAGYLTSVVNITGNAGTVTNGVYTTGSYADPSWITSLAYSKLTGAPTLATVATTGAYSDLAGKPTSITSFGITDGTSGQVLTTNGAGVFSFTTISGGGQAATDTAIAMAIALG